ncbi:MAG: phosphoribosylglycinamide formyltransferase [Acidiferrobacteraceae bacterium]
MTRLARVVVLISGRGSNLRAIIAARDSGDLPVTIAAVISNNPDAGGLSLARSAGIPAVVIDHRQFPDRTAFDRALAQEIDRHRPDLVVLAGFMRILGGAFIRHYQGRLMNIHPSLLPALAGLDTHLRAIQGGYREHGATVHFVVEEVDAGPIIAQSPVPVLADDTPETLAARVLAEEHRLYPKVIRWFAEGRLTLEGQQVLLDGLPVANRVP